MSMPIGIAKEGRELVVVSLLFALLTTWWWGWWSVPVWAWFIFCLQFFREPRIEITQSDGLALSPAEGKVCFVGQIETPEEIGIEGPTLKISIFMNVHNVHSNRAPVAGKVLAVTRFAGSFLNASLDKASKNNERNLVRWQTKWGQVACMQVAGLVARRIICDVRAEQECSAGERYGFIRFGSRVDTYLPPDTQSLVQVGDKVSCGSSVLAKFNAPAENTENKENKEAKDITPATPTASTP